MKEIKSKKVRRIRLFQDLQKNSPPKWKAYFVLKFVPLDNTFASMPPSFLSKIVLMESNASQNILSIFLYNFNFYVKLHAIYILFEFPYVSWTIRIMIIGSKS